MIPPTVLLVHLPYDTPESPQSRSLHALAAIIARTIAPPLSLGGGYAYDDFDTDNLPLAVDQARTDMAMTSQLQAHVAPLAATALAVTPLLRTGAPHAVRVQVAAELNAMLALLGVSQAHQGFASALGGIYEVLQRPSPTRCAARPPAAGHPKGRDPGRNAPARAKPTRVY